jgi:DNA-binding CsgD family transcriptional regulator
VPVAKKLQQIAAQFQMHYAAIHRLGPPQTLFRHATYSSTLRNIELSEWTLANLFDQHTLNQLLASNNPVFWCRNAAEIIPQNDPLNRLDIRFGVSVPFHNALGNHAALTICDSVASEFNMDELARLALPLIDFVVGAQRANTMGVMALSHRETDCLQWAAAGKTSIETGMILGLSPHTVNQYLSAATLKLEAVNRTHAVTKAVRLGLINLSAI